MLHDMSAKELRESIAANAADGYTFERTSAQRAHKWVKSGQIHSTDLWTDHNGRIRKAGIGC